MLSLLVASLLLFRFFSPVLASISSSFFFTFSVATHTPFYFPSLLPFIFLFLSSVVEKVFLSPFSLYRRPCFFPSFPSPSLPPSPWPQRQQAHAICLPCSFSFFFLNKTCASLYSVSRQMHIFFPPSFPPSPSPKPSLLFLLLIQPPPKHEQLK